MFFKKSKKSEDEAVVKRGIKKMDALITGAVLGGVVAGVYGVKKLRNSGELEKMEEEIEENSEKLKKLELKVVEQEEQLTESKSESEKK